MTQSIFTRIIKGEVPAYKIYEDQDCLAFLDINPNTLGHTLCIPKVQIDKFFDLDQDTYVKLLTFSRRVALAMEKAIDCNRIGMSVVGLEVPHAHIHLIPIHQMKDITFQSKTDCTAEDFQSIQEKIQAYI